MPRVVFKCNYIKAGKGGGGSYVRYISTRDGVEFITEASRHNPASEPQKKLIADILRDYPDAEELLEYADYTQNPTMGNASAFITQALDHYALMEAGREPYLKYIADRPGVERRGEHGLFSSLGTEVTLSQVCKQVDEHPGNVWMPIISLRREDATRLSYDNAENWQSLLSSYAGEMAEHMKIKPDNFHWYAAFHNQSHHPHIHMVCWSEDPKEGFLTTHGIEGIKSDLASRIFRQELVQVYEQKTARRDHLQQHSQQALRELCAAAQSGTCRNARMDQLLLELSARLRGHKGKKVYGYLNRQTKDIVDQIVDELEKEEAITQLYDAWYEMRNEVYHTYTDDPPLEIPLSMQKEFKRIKNMVIEEALRIGEPTMEAQALIDEPPQIHEPDIVDDGAPDLLGATEPVTPHSGVYMDWSNQYRKARRFLYGTKEEKPDLQAAYELMHREAMAGNALAMHDLGRMYADGLGMEADPECAQQWYAKALDAFQQIEAGNSAKERLRIYLRYRIGKMHMMGLGTEQDYATAAHWLRLAADAGHKYAQYSLGSLYYRGNGVEQSYEAAFSLYKMSADQGNAYAFYELGKMLRDGIGTAINSTEAQAAFKVAFVGFSKMAAAQPDDKLHYRLGQMLRDGVGVEPDAEKSVDYFKPAAEVGNQYAQYALGKLYALGKDVPRDRDAALFWLSKAAAQGNEYAQFWIDHIDEIGVHQANLFLSTTNLLRSLGNLFEQEAVRMEQTPADHIDRKRWRVLQQKKMSQGHAWDDQEPR